jgi:hypothetical protein
VYYITRLLLEFKDLNQQGVDTVIYDNVNKSTDDIFEGKMQLVSGINSYVIIDLKHKINRNKDLQIRFRLDPMHDINDNTIIFGQYIDFEFENIVSGTLILENIKGHFGSNSHIKDIEKLNFNSSKDYILPNTDELILTSRELVYDSNWDKYIPEEIAYFFENKWMNFNKTKTDIYSLNELQKFRNKQKNKDYKKYKFDSIINFDLFIIIPEKSIPDPVLKDELYKEICNTFFSVAESTETNELKKIEECFKATEYLANHGIKKIYYPKRDYRFNNSEEEEKDEEEGDVPSLPSRILEELEIMKQSRYVILIMPAVLCSSALVKVGCSLQMEKPIFVFPGKDIDLPTIIKATWKGIINVPTEYLEISKIPKHLIKNYPKLFPLIKK